MTCAHDFTWQEGSDEMPECLIHVDCDERCKALADPQTPDEVRAAYEHWRHHQYLCGCSHGC